MLKFRFLYQGTRQAIFANLADLVVPFGPAITVDGPATITVTYVSGTVSPGGDYVGPKGGIAPNDINQSPLQEARGVAPHGNIPVGALIGVFVPQATAESEGFQALDGTKNVTRVGIVPSDLFYIGESKTFVVKEAGTLFLGINDWIVSDSRGGFTVQVKAKPHFHGLQTVRNVK